jgi:hypothetical protein
VVKSAIQQAFVDTGGTLSHHHAVGTEHAQWLEQDISAPGVAMLRALFDGVDPGQNLNPGKIVGLAPAAPARDDEDVNLDGPSQRIVAEPVQAVPAPEPPPAPRSEEPAEARKPAPRP